MSHRTKFTPEDDQKLIQLVQAKPALKWAKIAELMQNKTSRQCRERYDNYLAVGINQAAWTQDEEDLLLRLYQEIGSSWAKMTQLFPGRTCVNIKNHFSKIKYRLSQSQEVPTTVNHTINTPPKPNLTLNLNHQEFHIENLNSQIKFDSNQPVDVVPHNNNQYLQISYPNQTVSTIIQHHIIMNPPASNYAAPIYQVQTHNYQQTFITPRQPVADIETRHKFVLPVIDYSKSQKSPFEADKTVNFTIQSEPKRSLDQTLFNDSSIFSSLGSLNDAALLPFSQLSEASFLSEIFDTNIGAPFEVSTFFDES